MANPKHICLGCRKPSHGERCRPCRLAEDKRLSLLAKTYNRQGHGTGIAIPPRTSSDVSFWAICGPDRFTEVCEGMRDRMALGIGASLHRPELMANWTF